ncbi:hypothetical protein PCL_09502 [Purpureocillium lilacinum]|uniref:Uncharacterized protein n=1 Tax=Purpureocillium lilacinum TaxID=33203 RepID=A0A2U3DQS9_PURLI|nr:hypothetical protein PCL_09502 [Purpureocillium lilacinum]
MCMFVMAAPEDAEPKNRNEYTVGWVCALPKEQTAATGRRHPDLPNPPKDDNTYTLGAIGPHNIVIACLPQGKYGTNSAATVATRMASTFPSIRLGFMVGIGSGIPPNVRLGDVVVSSPGNGFPGVVQWDFGKAEDEGKLVQTGALNNPPTALLTAVSKLRTKHDLTGARIPEYLYDLATNYPRLALRYAKPAGIRKPVSHNSQRGWFTWHGILSALLDAFLAFVWYSSGVWALTAGNGRSNNESTLRAAVEGSQRQSDDIPIHYGPIASGNRVIKDAKLRDRINNRFGGHVLCVEMEAAGLMDNFPCLVIRGVCDYADSAKNKEWQEYAAAVAAAYAKEIISMVPLDEVQQMDAIQKTIQRLGHQLDQMGATSSAIHSIVQGLEANTHYSEVEKWLSPPDPSTNYSHAKKQRHGCSGEWLLRRTEYSAWKSGQRPFLWLHGIPGCGKTILASTVLRDLEDDASIENLLYFFFDFTDTRKQSFEHALRSLVIQLYRKNKDTQENLDLLFASSETGKQQPSVHSLCNTFAAMAEQAGEVNIILDALDECRLQDDYRTEGLFPWMRRPEQHIKSAIENWADHEGIIPLQSCLVENDISTYVHTRVRGSEGLARWHSRPDIQDEIEVALNEKADGMFRWVTCQLDALENCLDPLTLRAALRSLPRTLDETYARILSNLPQEHRHRTVLILQFLAYSERPLTVEEAVDAIALDTNSKPRFDRQNRMPVPQEISRYCSSLVAVSNPKSDTSGETKAQLQLAHFSVKEYLLSDRLEAAVAEPFTEFNARASIAEVCLAYLLDMDQCLPTSQLKQSYWLAEYSARYWSDHAALAERNCPNVRALLADFFSRHAIRTASFRLYDPDRPWSNTHSVASALYYASLTGLSCSVETLLGKGADVNAQGGECGNALQAASYRGHEKVVGVLLNKDADVNAKGGRFGNALTAASYGGHETTVGVLLNKGADIDYEDGDYGSALQAASRRGHEKVVRILLDKGADVKAKGGRFGNALQAASHRGHGKVVGMLLNKGGDINAQGGYFGNALQAASYGGQEKVVRILLNKGADVNAKGGMYGNALQAASLQGHEKMVSMLLAKGADVNGEGGEYGSALQAASYRGHEKAVRILLDKGADVNANGGRFGNALQAASHGGHDNVVRILLDKGADVNAEGSRYGNALQAASDGGHEEVVRMLLAKGADVNTEDRTYVAAAKVSSLALYKNLL